MNRKLLSVAVASAFMAPGAALAQSSTVQVYGTLILLYNFVDYGSGTGPNQRVNNDMLTAPNSSIGFKGEEQLGGSLSAWFQCESTLDVTGQLAAWCGKNSAFGMKGNFGNIYAGIWDSPMKVTSSNFRPFQTTSPFGMAGILWNGAGSDVGNGPAGVPAANTTSFTRRQTNLLTYDSPQLAGFQGSIAVSTANEATAQTNATAAKKPRMWSVGGTYTNGPLILGAAYERHTNYNPAGIGSVLPPPAAPAVNYTGGDDRAWNAGIAYTFMGTLKLSGIYADTRYETSPGTSLQAKGWGLYGDWAVTGPHRLRAGYSHLKSTSGNFGTAAAPVTVGVWVANGGAGNTGATLYSLQYAYSFSKRTELSFGYSRLNNDALSAQALQSLGKGNAGQNQSAWVLGVKHTF